jgi:MFS family permease
MARNSFSKEMASHFQNRIKGWPQAMTIGDSTTRAVLGNEPEMGTAGSLWVGRRLWIAGLLFMNIFVNYMHRISLSVAAPSIAHDFHWDAGKMGLLFSSYQWTYCLFLLLWGWGSDRIGTRWINALSVTLWSIAAMLTGLATGFAGMMSTRLALGAGEAASFPTSSKVVRQWFPACERGQATAIFNSGSFAGPAFSAPLVTWLLLREGWRLAFVVTGALGFVWVAAWLALFRKPSECSWLPAPERDYILANTETEGTSKAAGKGALFRLIRRQTMWGLFLTQGCCAYTMLLFLFWLPSYLVQSRHMSMTKASWFTSIPYVVAAILGLFVGKLSDALLSPEQIRNGKRRRLLLVFIFLSGSVLLTNVVSNEYILLLLVSISLSCISSALALNITLTSDLVWDSGMLGVAIGFLILGGNIFGSLVPIITGYIVKWTGNFDYAFYLAGFLLLMAAIFCVTMTRAPIRFEDAVNESIL